MKLSIFAFSSLLMVGQANVFPKSALKNFRASGDSIPVDDPICSDTSCVKFINVNVHYLLRKDGSGNFTETSDGYADTSRFHRPEVTGYRRAVFLIDGANQMNRSNKKNWHSPAGTGIPSKRFQFVLRDVYFHRDDTIFKSSTLLYPDFEAATRKYGVNISSEINIFMTHETEATGISGVVCCELSEEQYKRMGYLTIFMRDWEVWYVKDWQPGLWNTLNHEFGHLMGLKHDWEAQFADMKPYAVSFPEHNQGCANYSEDPNDWCHNWDHISNNSMGASSYDRTLTPDQVAFMHAHLETFLKGYVDRCECAPAARPSFFKRLRRLFSSPRKRRADTPPRS